MTKGVSLDLGQMMASKEEVVSGLTQGIEFLFKKNKIEYIKGRGKIIEAGKVEVELAGLKKVLLETKNILIATGSESTPLPGVTVDEKR